MANTRERGHEMRTAAIVLVAALAVGSAGCSAGRAPTAGAPVAAATSASAVAPASASASATPTHKPPVTAAPGARYTDPKGRFSLVPPPLWVFDNRPNTGLQLALFAPGYDDVPEGHIHAVMTVITSDDDPGIDKYGMRAVSDAMRDTVQEGGGKIVDEGTVTLADGVPAYLMSVEGKRGDELVHDVLLMTGDKRGTLQVEALTPRKDWGGLEAAVIASFRTMRLH